MDQRINQWVPYWGNRVEEWDVVNEPIGAGGAGWDLIGWDNLPKYFAQVKQLQPGMKTYLNDWGLASGGADHQNQDIALVNQCIDQGVIDGIGMQLYPKGKLDIPSIIKNVQMFADLGIELKLTEYSYIQATTPVSDETKLRDTFDVLTALYSIKQVNGFMWWGCFGDGSILDANGKLTPVGEEIAYLMYDKWWTNTSGSAGSDGTYTTSGFFGNYNITVTANGRTKTVPASFLMYNGLRDFTVVMG